MIYQTHTDEDIFNRNKLKIVAFNDTSDTSEKDQFLTLNYKSLEKYEVIDDKLQNVKYANCEFFHINGIYQ